MMANDAAQQKKPEGCSFVIFGVTGDLAHRLIIPALYNLATNGLLPDNLCVVGVTRKGMSNDELRNSLLVLLSQKVAANDGENHLFGKIHTSAMGGWNGSAEFE
jgi:glucose-6-phosphate 1-dehydrogenase